MSRYKQLLKTVALFILTTIFIFLGRYNLCIDKAVDKWEKILQLEPNYARAYFSLGVVMAERRNYDDAVRYFNEALRIKPDWAEAYYNLGGVYARQGKLNTALDYFLASYSYDKTYFTGAYNAACALTQLKRFDEAIQYLEISLADESSYSFALNDNSLDPLRELGEFKRIIAEAGERFGSDSAGRIT